MFLTPIPRLKGGGARPGTWTGAPGTVGTPRSGSTRSGRFRRAAPRAGQNRGVSAPRPLSDRQFAELLAFRVALRRFLAWSEEAAEAVGVTATQHQLLIAVRGHPDPAGPTISDVARYLLVRHHSAVGLIDRAEARRAGRPPRRSRRPARRAGAAHPAR